jgi:hypothetical protein
MRICEKIEKRQMIGMVIIISGEITMVLLQYEVFPQQTQKRFMMKQLWLILDIIGINFMQQMEVLVIIGKIMGNMINYGDEKTMHHQIIGD